MRVDKNVPLSGWSNQVSPRWRLSTAWDAEGQEIAGVLLLTVITAKGTGRKAKAQALIDKDLADDRRLVAWQIRELRAKAMSFRANNQAAH